jgi:predicted aspartyl protease
MSFTYRYKSLCPGTRLLPLAEDVRFYFPLAEPKFNLIIDSGATYTTFPVSVADEFGVKYKRTDDAECANGASCRAYLSEESVLLGGKYKMKIPILWMDSERVTPLLGRGGVFDRFRVIFDEFDRKIEFVPRRILEHFLIK